MLRAVRLLHEAGRLQSQGVRNLLSVQALHHVSVFILFLGPVWNTCLDVFVGVSLKLAGLIFLEER